MPLVLITVGLIAQYLDTGNGSLNTFGVIDVVCGIIWPLLAVLFAVAKASDG